jgi:epoxide hydrolase-like predicted phosphatase
LIKAVIFDFGDVVAHMKNSTGTSLKYFVPRLLKIDNYKFLRLYKKYSKLMHRGEIQTQTFWSIVSRKFNLKQSGRELSLLLSRNYEANVIIDKNVEKIIKKIRNKGYITALLSNIVKPSAVINQKKGFYKLFKPKILSCYVNMRKPEIRIYKITLKKLRMKPEECLFIDDNEKNLKPAKKLGIKTILFKNSRQLEKDLRKLEIL